jgi:pimeloyl-ACP methyl ester carboxylesterase
VSTPPFLDLPACTRALRLTTGRGPFAVLEATPPAGAPTRATALLVPGFTGSKEDFIAILEPLAAAGYRVVAIDQRGQHETPGPAEASAYTRAALVDDLLAVIDALGTRPHVVGHSFGGLVCRSLALRAPERLDSLTIMSSGPAAICEPEIARLLLLEEALGALDPQTVWEAMRAVEADAGQLPPADPVIDEFLHARWLGTVPQGLMAMAHQLRTEPDTVDELATVVAKGLPALVLSGSEDYAWPVPWQADLARRLGVRHVVVDGAGHSPAVDGPGVTADALATFWGSVTPGR